LHERSLYFERTGHSDRRGVLLIFDGGQISFGDLAEILQISRGSVSSSSRMLEEFGLIRRTTKPGERQDFFELEDSPYVNLLDRAFAGRVWK